jgi:hypothetical protein
MLVRLAVVKQERPRALEFDRRQGREEFVGRVGLVGHHTCSETSPTQRQQWLGPAGGNRDALQRLDDIVQDVLALGLGKERFAGGGGLHDDEIEAAVNQAGNRRPDILHAKHFAH